ncbi:oxygen-independent coproporphyrinogen III oxidase [Cohaesibacter gelatinilyticus]|uniref:Coproporphyrinogen-III oxidase n=1 Tax=Cohaesibacter gelatinilyticus TaxID=372072 RepID=A0A285NBM6_9HYPH|nr:oxygen-independent coproporphyrinogen III oxidase [Cohaesibacter gelatinilyticus]SNZ05081.1 coproporphyrinogen III oxidase, anaerobic [Cohaesibacter gelatinilyticus]HAT85878.1 oxygen-independent coproporphyrinogen III oxidase [Hyphomicrobiales bacterium]
MTNVTLKYATRAVPRYTSYPTAPHFDADFGRDIYAEWLKSVDPSVPISLYLHVPFCQSMCHYCGCYTKITQKEKPLQDYADMLVREVELVASKLPKQQPVSHIHWGGGTPSILPRDAFLRVVEAVKTHFTFTDDMEHAIELDPRTVTPELAETLRLAGINRTSLGVQDFDLKVQEAVGRVQPYEIVKASVEALRAVGIEEINLDLMYGLPHQTRETIRNSVDLTASLNPTRLALFGYAHVPWMKKHQRLIKEELLPNAEERIALFDDACQALADYGFEKIGLDHFAKSDDPLAIAAREGSMRRNFQGYTTDEAEILIGLGASSIGKMPQGYIQNSPDFGGWVRSVESGELPIARGLAMDSDDRARAAIIMSIMTAYTVDIAAVAKDFNVNLEAIRASSYSYLDELIEDGVAKRNGDIVEVTHEGRPLVRLVAAAFDAYLHKGKGRHSVAV